MHPSRVTQFLPRKVSISVLHTSCREASSECLYWKSCPLHWASKSPMLSSVQKLKMQTSWILNMTAKFVRTVKEWVRVYKSWFLVFFVVVVFIPLAFYLLWILFIFKGHSNKIHNIFLAFYTLKFRLKIKQLLTSKLACRAQTSKIGGFDNRNPLIPLLSCNSGKWITYISVFDFFLLMDQTLSWSPSSCNKIFH